MRKRLGHIKKWLLGKSNENERKTLRGGLRARLVILVAIPCALMFLISAFTGWSINSLASRLQYMAESRIPAVQTLGDLSSAVLGASNALNVAFQNVNDDGERTGGVQSAKAAVRRFDEISGEFLALKKDPKIEEAYKHVQDAWPKLKQNLEQAIELVDIPSPENVQKAGDLIKGSIRPAINDISIVLDNLRDTYREQTKIQIEETQKATRMTLVLALLLCAVGILVSALNGFFTGHQVVATMAAITRSIESVGSRLREASLQAQESSQSLARSAEEQAASLTESASCLEELRAMIARNTESAETTAEVSGEAQKSALEGKAKIGRLVEAVEHIGVSNLEVMDQVTDGNAKLAEIQKVINEIGSKTKIINEIVFQTRLLSFNASVEAARAGEHGKGFAVVAEEVGNLARMSGQASHEISSLLDSSLGKVQQIINESRSRVENLREKGEKQIQEGSLIAQDCSEMLEQLVHVVTTTAQRSGEISQASREQANGVQELVNAVKALDSGMRKTNDVSVDSAKAADRLTSEVEALEVAASDLASLMGIRASSNVVQFSGRSDTRSAKRKSA